MPRVPQVNARRLVAALKRAGFEVRRRQKTMRLEVVFFQRVHIPQVRTVEIPYVTVDPCLDVNDTFAICTH